MSATAAAREAAARGRELLADGDVDGAIALAREALAALGEPPPSVEIRDDTKMKIYAADERIETGHLADGAEVLLDVLEIRIQLHEQLGA